MRARTARSYDAVRRGHSRLTTVTLHNLDGAVGEVPISDGYVGLDLTSKRGARYGSLTVPGYEWFEAFNPSRAPWVAVSQEIEGETWNLGEWPVASVELESPGGLVTVGLEDWAARRIRAVTEVQTDLAFGNTVKQTFQYYVGLVMPNRDFDVVRDDTNGAATPYVKRLGAGQDAWTAIHELATVVGAVPMVTSLSTGELRVFDPYAPDHEDVTGTLNRVRTGWDMDGVVNRVTFLLNSEGSDGGRFIARRTLSDGSPWDFDREGVGYCILPESETVPTATQAIADAKAQYLYDRRAGAVKAVSLRVVPQPWLEAGDVIAWQDGRGGSDRGLIDSIEYPLRADQAMNIRLRGTPVI